MSHLGSNDFKDREQVRNEQADRIQKGLYGGILSKVESIDYRNLKGIDGIEKSEGSKGGKVIGHTKSGKPVYENHNHPSHKNFSKEEHGNAWDIHQGKIDEYKNKREKLSGKAHKEETEETRHKINETDKKVKHHIEAKNHHETESNKKEHKIIGKTDSGKSIYENHDHESHKNFTSKDHKDASEYHEDMAGTGMFNTKKHKEEAEKHKQSAKHPGKDEGHKEDSKEAHEKRGFNEASGDEDVTGKNEKLKKSEDDTIEKGGEGSKGGKVIGHTRTGKAIYDSFGHISHKNFNNPDEHHEAALAHGVERNKVRESIIANHGDDKAKVVDKMNTDKSIQHHDSERQKHLNEYGKLMEKENKYKTATLEKIKTSSNKDLKDIQHVIEHASVGWSEGAKSELHDAIATKRANNYTIPTSQGDIDLRSDPFHEKHKEKFSKLNKEDHKKLASAHRNMSKEVDEAALKGNHSGLAHHHEEEHKRLTEKEEKKNNSKGGITKLVIDQASDHVIDKDGNKHDLYDLAQGNESDAKKAKELFHGLSKEDQTKYFKHLNSQDAAKEGIVEGFKYLISDENINGFKKSESDQLDLNEAFDILGV